VRSGRQKSAEASAESAAFTARLTYTAIAGLELAATLQHQDDVTQDADFGSDKANADARLLELHARYQHDALTITGLYAQWQVNGAGFEAKGMDRQRGAYLEAAYRVSPQFGVFVRTSEWDNEAGNAAESSYSQHDIGFNYWLHERVVLKADYADQRHDNASKAQDAVNLGIGWSF
jgi:hypothetical protein